MLLFQDLSTNLSKPDGARMHLNVFFTVYWLYTHPLCKDNNQPSTTRIYVHQVPRRCHCWWIWPKSWRLVQSSWYGWKGGRLRDVQGMSLDMHGQAWSTNFMCQMWIVNSERNTLPETNIAHENPIFPSKYHQNGGFSMAMLVYRSVDWEVTRFESFSALAISAILSSQPTMMNLTCCGWLFP